MPTITAGLDGSPQSLAAADWAAREAEQRGADLRLVYGLEQPAYTYAPFAGLPAAGALDVQRPWAEKLLDETRSRLAHRHPALRITVGVSGDQPVAALLAAAESSELLVLGSRGLGALAGFVVGSVALAVVARAERPVVLVRAGERAEDEHLPDAGGEAATTTPYRDVVLGVDLENPADAVVGFAFEAAQRRAAGLRVVHGWSLPAAYGYGAAMDADLNEELAEQARERLAEVLAPWRAKFPGVEVREQAVIGSAGRHLVHASRDAALVVVGRRIRRAAVGGHIGPVTHAALQHAVAPVAVVPHD
ncbi:universal stress protein [Streptomyces cylindrosporus]|uniref:Universal stress protein n=1 Tax=Streptomyces cylindrosporus TaxID=2927583 RepID=A0ABS9YLT5_9ACTN|nr:universal stress protein [Streptomyces cylindrosporus]MCI3278179.1 universal stress protein [Streptomyces cylindrosporus]